MKSDKYEWELVFAEKVLRRNEWVAQSRIERIDPQNPDDRYGAVIAVRLVAIATGEALYEIGIPDDARPVCGHGRRMDLSNSAINGEGYKIGWRAANLKYIVPFSEDGIRGRAYFEAVRD
ncbi:MAG: hypothetical protein WBP42_11575 [Candidatus Zixiibacteriota bacterium]